MQASLDRLISWLAQPLSFLYFLILGYLGIWGLALFLARAASDENRLGSYDKATYRAWIIAFLVHLVVAVVFVTAVVFSAISNASAWWHIPLYFVCLAVDVVCLVSLVSLVSLGKQSSAKKRPPTGRKAKNRSRQIPTAGGKP